ncbi:hypothetical protein X975_21261, partial [Stegodyphus mimosarum]
MTHLLLIMNLAKSRVYHILGFNHISSFKICKNYIIIIIIFVQILVFDCSCYYVDNVEKIS